MATTNLINQYSNLLKGTTVKKVSIPGGMGSITLMDFYRVEMVASLYISCAWKLVSYKDDKIQLICNWRDNDELGGRMIIGMNTLESDIVEEAAISESNDITIKFVSGKALYIFSDIAIDDLDFENWFLTDFGRSKILTSTLSLDLVEEEQEVV